MATEGQLNQLIVDFRDATYNTGWLSCAIEKGAKTESDEYLKDLAKQMQEQIARRQMLHAKIMDLFFPKH